MSAGRDGVGAEQGARVRTLLCAACLGTKECWVCLGTGACDTPTRLRACHSCEGTRVCRYCKDVERPRRRVLDQLEPVTADGGG